MMLHTVFAWLQTRMADDEGATAAEYGLILALVAVVIIVAVGALGTQLTNAFNYIANAIDTAIPG